MKFNEVSYPVYSLGYGLSNNSLRQLTYASSKSSESLGECSIEDTLTDLCHISGASSANISCNS